MTTPEPVSSVGAWRDQGRAKSGLRVLEKILTTAPSTLADTAASTSAASLDAAGCAPAGSASTLNDAVSKRPNSRNANLDFPAERGPSTLNGTAWELAGEAIHLLSCALRH